MWSTLTWLLAHIQICFCFLSSWMECEITSAVFLLFCTQPNLRLFSKTEICWFYFIFRSICHESEMPLCVCSALCCQVQFIFIIEFRMVKLLTTSFSLFFYMIYFHTIFHYVLSIYFVCPKGFIVNLSGA